MSPLCGLLYTFVTTRNSTKIRSHYKNGLSYTLHTTGVDTLNVTKTLFDTVKLVRVKGT